MALDKGQKVDPATFAVLMGRFDTIVGTTLQIEKLVARSVLVGESGDCSAFLCDKDGNIVSISEGILAHTGASDLAVKPIVKAFEGDVHEGDMFYFNHPYQGNTHLGDINVAVPVFVEGKHVFWMANRSHLTDCAAVTPISASHYHRDKWEEGIHFAPLRIQRNYKEIKDVMAIFRNNMRFFDLWYGDHLAQVAAVRSGEKMVQDVCKQYGLDTVLQFVDDYNDYADRMMTEAVRKLPKGTWKGESWHDPVATISPDDGIRVVAKMTIDPEEATITYDLSESGDQVPGGTNTSYAGAVTGCMAATFQCLDSRIPKIYGSMKHVKVKVRQGSAPGGPIWPTGTSMGTTDMPNRIGAAIQKAWEQAVPELALGGTPFINGGAWVGTDTRRGAPRMYGDGFFLGMGGGPGSKGHDGWVNYVDQSCSGTIVMASVEISEYKMPIIIKEVFANPDTGGAGRWRGGTGGGYTLYGYDKSNSLFSLSCGDGQVYPPEGVCGGKDGALARQWLVDMKTGETVKELPAATPVIPMPSGHEYHMSSNGGGGYGDPLERDPELVRRDAREGIISVKAARDVYGVALDTKPETYSVDAKATAELRRKLKGTH